VSPTPRKRVWLAVRLVRENRWVADPDHSRPTAAQRLREARRGWGWSQNDLAAEVEKVRIVHNHRPSDRESLRRQIISGSDVAITACRCTTS
jgi:hypothetical protein